jgi:hypothetical protein
LLSQANGILTQWQREPTSNGWRITMGLRSYQPIEITLNGTRQCRVSDNLASVSQNRDALQITLPARQVQALVMECQ